MRSCVNEEHLNYFLRLQTQDIKHHTCAIIEGERNQKYEGTRQPEVVVRLILIIVLIIVLKFVNLVSNCMFRYSSGLLPHM